MNRRSRVIQDVTIREQKYLLIFNNMFGAYDPVQISEFRNVFHIKISSLLIECCLFVMLGSEMPAEDSSDFGGNGSTKKLFTDSSMTDVEFTNLSRNNNNSETISVEKPFFHSFFLLFFGGGGHTKIIPCSKTKKHGHIVL